MHKIILNTIDKIMNELLSSRSRKAEGHLISKENVINLLTEVDWIDRGTFWIISCIVVLSGCLKATWHRSAHFIQCSAEISARVLHSGAVRVECAVAKWMQPARCTCCVISDRTTVIKTLDSFTAKLSVAMTTETSLTRWSSAASKASVIPTSRTSDRACRRDDEMRRIAVIHWWRQVTSNSGKSAVRRWSGLHKVLACKIWAMILLGDSSAECWVFAIQMLRAKGTERGHGWRLARVTMAARITVSASVCFSHSLSWTAAAFAAVAAGRLQFVVGNWFVIRYFRVPWKTKIS